MNRKIKNIRLAILPLIILNIVLVVNFIYSNEASSEDYSCPSTRTKPEIDMAAIFTENVEYQRNKNCYTYLSGKTLFEYYGNNTDCWDLDAQFVKDECEEFFPYGGRGTIVYGGNAVIDSADGIFLNGYDGGGIHWLMTDLVEPVGNAVGFVKEEGGAWFGNNVIIDNNAYIYSEEFSGVKFTEEETPQIRRNVGLYMTSDEGMNEVEFIGFNEDKLQVTREGTCGECMGTCSEGNAGGGYQFLAPDGVKVANTLKADNQIRECGNTLECEEACCRILEYREQDLFYVAEEVRRHEEYVGADCPENCDIDEFCSPQPYPKWIVVNGRAVYLPPNTSPEELYNENYIELEPGTGDPGGGSNPGGENPPPTPGGEPPPLIATPPPITEITGTIYYVSTSGTASWSQCQGNINNPCSLPTANANLQAGEAALMLGGTYREQIRPVNSGTENAPIIYTNNNNDVVNVYGLPQQTPTVSLFNTDYVIIDGLNLDLIDPPLGRSTIIWIRAENTIIRNNNLVRNETDYISQRLNDYRVKGIALSAGRNNLVENNRIQYMSYIGMSVERDYFSTIRNNIIVDTWSNNINISSSHNNIQGVLIEGNILGNSLISDGVQYNGDFSLSPAEFAIDHSNRGTIIRNNIFYGHGENAIDLKGTSDHVVEGNIIYNITGDNDGPWCGHEDSSRWWDMDCHNWGGGAIMHGSGQDGINTIIRNNVVYDSNSAIRTDTDYKVYNNTLINNNRDWQTTNSYHTNNGRPTSFYGIVDKSWPDRIGIKNNIIMSHNGAEIILKQTPVRVDIDYNLYYNREGTDFIEFIASPDQYIVRDFAGWRQFLTSNSAWTGNDEHSLNVDAGFVNAPPKPNGAYNLFNFNLRSGSPAIDGGGHLTNTRGSGSGRVIPVDDSRYFFDGYGKVSGDTIIVGSNSSVRITGIDYTNHRLTVDRSISWGNNARVYFCPGGNCFSGSAPDMGAYEFGSGGGFGAQTCLDGTPYNSCTPTAPFYCNGSGAIVENCTECGCRNGWLCTNPGASTNQCTAPPTEPPPTEPPPTTPPTTPPPTNMQYLRVSSNRHFLQYADGSDFFWMGDTAWHIPSLSPSEVDQYMQARTNQGFNLIQFPVDNFDLHHQDTPNYAGEHPFIGTHPYSSINPNETYWQHIDYIVDKAAEYNMYVVLLSAWGFGLNEGFTNHYNTLYQYGQFLGNRYSNRMNVMYAAAGEFETIMGSYTPLTDSTRVTWLRRIGQGINSTANSNQLITIHGNPGNPGENTMPSDFFHNDSWLDFYGNQTWQRPEFIDNQMWGDWQLTGPVKPTINMEPGYEGAISSWSAACPVNSNAWAQRFYAYWSVFQGGFGHTYGHQSIAAMTSHFGDAWDYRNEGVLNQTALNAEGAGDMIHLRNLMESKPITTRVPDQTIITSARGSDICTRSNPSPDLRVATRDSGGSWAFVYLTQGGAVTVNMARITTAQARARWYNPRTGAYSNIGNFSASGTRQFRAPSSGQNNDWVLVLEAI